MSLPTVKTIKSIITPRYEVRLVQVESGAYRVAFNSKLNKEPILGEPMDDYNLASLVFDNKVQELDGH